MTTTTAPTTATPTSVQEEIDAAEQEGGKVLDDATRELVSQYRKLREKRDQISAQMDTIADALKEQMKAQQVMWYTDEHGVTLVTRSEYDKKTFDKKAAIKELGAEVIGQFEKVTHVSSLRVK